MRVEWIAGVSDELVGALHELLPQLSRRRPMPTRAHLDALVGDPRTALFVARDGEDRIVGTLTLASHRKPTAHDGWIEDVVVDESARGHGVGEALVRAALDLAAAWGLDGVKLTSRPAREAANRLYLRLGFESVETNVYVWRAR